MSERFPDNSRMPKAKAVPIVKAEGSPEVEQRAQKVVTGTVTTKKPSIAKRLRIILFGDNGKSVGSYLVEDVFIPAFRDTLDEMITGSKDLLLHGERRSRPRSGALGSRMTFQNTNYGGMSRPGGARPVVDPVQPKGQYYFEDIVLSSKGDAEVVLTQLIDILDEYGQVTIADLRDTVGMSGQYTDRNWGWISLANARTERLRGTQNYILDLPQPIYLK